MGLGVPRFGDVEAEVTRDALETLMQAAVGEADGVSLTEREPWRKRARCREHPEVEFFPTRGTDVRPAKAVCRECPVWLECFAYALDHPSLVGIWAGTGERGRKHARRALRFTPRHPGLPTP